MDFLPSGKVPVPHIVYLYPHQYAVLVSPYIVLLIRTAGWYIGGNMPWIANDMAFSASEV
jgi:hypothetical protein